VRIFNEWKFTRTELFQLTLLRALEWMSWPAFLLLPVVPVLYAFVQPYFVWPGLVLLNVLWRPLRTKWINIEWATFGSYLGYLRWFTIPFMTGYFLWHKRWWLSLLCPFTSRLVGLAGYFTRSTDDLAEIQSRFLLMTRFMEEKTEMEKLCEPLEKITLELQELAAKNKNK